MPRAQEIVVRLVAVETLTLSARSQSNGRQWEGYRYVKCKNSEPPLVKKIRRCVHYLFYFYDLLTMPWALSGDQPVSILQCPVDSG